MGKHEDLAGRRFGRVVAMQYKGRAKGYQSLWSARCDCGSEFITTAGRLKSGHTQSCGCLQKERTSETKTIHGFYRDASGKRSRLNRVWSAMKERCQNPNNKSFSNYGGRGITVCDEWQTFEPFHTWAMAAGYREGLTIDRIDNDKSYSPDNCRWTTTTIQSRNKRSNVILTFNGQTKILADWALKLGMDRGAIELRLKRGWTVEKALTTPIGGA